mmetsp:Transcript_35861/g.70542  ORF Transcript_35861/g.70542 Transcript_35861/m.70542 type:complete len:131 (-) Transcript_35861:56-448(-)
MITSLLFVLLSCGCSCSCSGAVDEAADAIVDNVVVRIGIVAREMILGERQKESAAVLIISNERAALIIIRKQIDSSDDKTTPRVRYGRYRSFVRACEMQIRCFFRVQCFRRRNSSLQIRWGDLFCLLKEQ